ncbi:MAG: hypothetical protein HKN06_09300 [Gammaproteobacteria bacterium]|nr:hypothetical protein [Gammaproteobacteria bacterium]
MKKQPGGVPRSTLRGVIALSTMATIGLTSNVHATDVGLRKGSGYFSLTYQLNSTDGFESSIGDLPIGSIDTQVMNFEFQYALSDRLTIIAGIPYVRKRYNNGPLPHDPLLLDPPRPFVENVDLGGWNSGFQDLNIGARYLVREGTFSIEPFAYLGVPSNEYPFYGNAAIGQQLTRLQVGSSFMWFPGLSNASYRADIGYVFVEKTLGVNVNYWNIRAETGYQFGPRITGRLFTLLKKGSGLSVPTGFPGFPGELTDENWYQHDRTLKHNYWNIGIGLDWALNDHYSISSNYMEMIWEDQVNILEYAFTVSLARAF